MLKKWITLSIYYIQEMLTYLFALLILFVFTEEPLKFGSYYLWLAFILLIGFPVLMMLKKRVSRYREVYYGLFIPILLILAYFIWDLPLLFCFLLTILPCWRLILLAKEEVDSELVIKRFIWFVFVLITGYLFLRVMSVDIELNFVLSYLWIQFGLLLLGILYNSYVDEREDHGTSLGHWLKNQSLFLYLSAGFGVLAILASYLLPGLQFILKKIPDVLVWVLNSGPVKAFLYWLMPEKQLGPGADLPVIELNFEIDEEELEELEEVSTGILDYLILIGGIFVSILIIVFIVSILVVFIRKVYNRKDSTQKKQGVRTSTDGLRGAPKHQGRKPAWAQDEIRRLYQSLLIYADQKGEMIGNRHTARTWVLPYQASERENQIWDKINRIYEQKRYSETPLDEEDVKSFKKDIQQAKSELSQYHKEKKKELKLERKLEKKERKARAKELGRPHKG